MKWICTNKTINAMMASPQTANVESESENASVLVSQFDMKGNSILVPYSLLQAWTTTAVKPRPSPRQNDDHD